MTAVLLARAGIETLVLEKHGDFLRDFRGDTVHPSTLEVIAELGWLEDFLKRPHQKLTRLTANIEGTEITVADFRHVPARCNFIALMPQWDFLNFLVEKARAYPKFNLQMNTEVIDIVEVNGKATGIRAKTPHGETVIQADIVIAADGRNSTLREKAGLITQDIGAPMDVLWMHLPRQNTDPTDSMGWIRQSRFLFLINRGDYWQTGFLVRKGSFDAIVAKGIASFRQELASMVPFFKDRMDKLASFDDVKLLVVKVNRLERWWRPGMLCIGDAAHAMSPIGGVGINLAIQDAVATANILAKPLREGTLSDKDLEQVQRRRDFPTRATQALQVFIQKRVVDRALSQNRKVRVGPTLRLIKRLPRLQSIPAFLIGVGIRPEHVKTLS